MVVGDTTVQPEKFGTLYESVILTGQMMPSKDKQASLIALLRKVQQRISGKRDAVHPGSMGQDRRIYYLPRTNNRKSETNRNAQ